MRALALAAALLCAAGTQVSAQLAIVGRAALLDRRLSDNGAIERQTGLTAGLGVALSRGHVGLELGVSGGKLTPKTAGTPDVDCGTALAEVAYRLAPWVIITAGAEASAYASPLGSQRWILPRLGGRIELPFAGLPGLVYVAGAVIVGGSSNAVAGSSSGLVARAGVRAVRGRMALFAEYQMERLTLSDATGRLEQRSEAAAGLRLRL